MPEFRRVLFRSEEHTSELQSHDKLVCRSSEEHTSELQSHDNLVCRSSDVCSRSEEHTSELQSHDNLVCRLLLEKKSHVVQRRLHVWLRGCGVSDRGIARAA